MRHVLFLCSQNRSGSKTAEQVFSGWPGVEVASAGLDASAPTPVSPELLAWADTIFVMEKSPPREAVPEVPASPEEAARHLPGHPG